MLPIYHSSTVVGTIHRAVDVQIDGKQTVEPVLNGLVLQFENIITASDTLGDEYKRFELDIVKSQLLQEEQAAL